MSKQDILHILEENPGCYVSGEDLARRLGLSRAAVWKSIRVLREEGYRIASRTNNGYCLEESGDALEEDKIRAGLRAERLGTKIMLYKMVDSTNTRLREEAFAGAPEGTVVISEEQSAGKGRLGRSFHSPPRNGIYMSILLRPEMPFDRIHFLTILAAVCVVEAIRVVAGVEAQIKWVNDVLIGGNKVCGILSEASVEGESGRLSFVVVGIGINVGTTSEFPALQGNVASALGDVAGTRPARCALIAEVLNQMEHYYYPYLETQDSSAFLERYRDSLCLLGESVSVTQGNESYLATAVELSTNGGLIVKMPDGTVRELTSGEVSVRPVSGQGRISK